MRFKQTLSLPEPDHSLAALEPAVSQRTMELHRGKQLKGYVDKLIAGTKYENMAPDLIVNGSEGALFINAPRKSDKKLSGGISIRRVFFNDRYSELMRIV